MSKIPQDASMAIEDLKINSYDEDNDLIAAVVRDKTPQLKIGVPSCPTVVLGKGSKPETELHVDVCLDEDIPLRRRPGGGCAVVIDPGNIIISVVLPTQGIKDNTKYFHALSDWLIQGLHRLGIDRVRGAGISDLTIEDRKIAGASIYRTAEYLYYSATLLVNPRIELIERYLQHPPREPQYRQGRKHRDFIISLKQVYPSHDTTTLAEALRRTLSTHVTQLPV